MSGTQFVSRTARKVPGHAQVLVPDNKYTEEKMSRWKNGTSWGVRVKHVRDEKTHARYFAMINLAFQNQEQFTDEDEFRISLQVLAGQREPGSGSGKYASLIEMHNGQILLIPKRIDHCSMPEREFRELYNDVLLTIISMVENFKGMEPATFEQEVLNFAGLAA